MADGTSGTPAYQTPAWRRRGNVALTLFAACAGLTLLAFVAGALDFGPGVGIATLLALGSAAIGVGFGIGAMIAMVRATERVSRPFAGVVWFLTIAVGGAFAMLGALLAFIAVNGFARGRQLRRRGKVLLPPLREGRAWTGLELAPSVPEDLRAPLAAQWRENGRTEHASVAAFARLQLDLLALGAPPELLHAASRDQRDEIRHTELCFALARALDGREVEPGTFGEAKSARTISSNRRLALAELAVDSLVDGALHEGLSARVVAKLVKRCEDAATREVLREIAADEGRHAKHGWDVVEWCLAEGGEDVARALRGAVEALPDGANSALPQGARGGAWERYGIHGDALEAAEHASARAEIARRVARLTEPLLGPSPAQPALAA